MKILLVTPAGQDSRAGNRATATRWAGFLRRAGHQVEIVTAYGGERADLLIALHAWRSAQAVADFATEQPRRPRVVVLTGTDIYRFQRSHPTPTLHSMVLADVLVGLHEKVADDIPARFHGCLQVVLQSATEPEMPVAAPDPAHFDLCVVGHLREEKDSLRAAWAVRDVPAESRLRVIQVGRAHDDDWAARAGEEMRRNARYQWRGEVAQEAVWQLLKSSRAMVMSSRMEGGANAVAEACVAGLPVLASDIPGNVGMLGEDYPGYYAVADTDALRALMLRAEGESRFLEVLASYCHERAALFTPEGEAAGVFSALERACVLAAKR